MVNREHSHKKVYRHIDSGVKTFVHQQMNKDLSLKPSNFRKGTGGVGGFIIVKHPTGADKIRLAKLVHQGRVKVVGTTSSSALLSAIKRTETRIFHKMKQQLDEGTGSLPTEIFSDLFPYLQSYNISDSTE